MDEHIKTDIINLVEGSRDAIVSTVDDDGFPISKSMFRRANEGLGIFWFSTNTSAAHTGHFKRNPKASIYFFDPLNIRGLLLTGTVQVCEDTQTKRNFWNDGDEQYYELGPTDPDYCMLRFIADKGRYYGGSSKLVFTAKDMTLLHTEVYRNGWQVGI